MKIILGAGDTALDGWISTDRHELDLTSRRSFENYFKDRKADAFLAEHVFEHLSFNDGILGASYCREFLTTGGTLRIAVPDRLHKDPEYLRWTEPGGIGPGADDHKVFYDIETLCSMLASAGFDHLEPLEWWGQDHEFHAVPWTADRGFVRRSLRNDSRNKTRAIPYTSVIVDAINVKA